MHTYYILLLCIIRERVTSTKWIYMSPYTAGDSGPCKIFKNKTEILKYEDASLRLMTGLFIFFLTRLFRRNFRTLTLQHRKRFHRTRSFILRTCHTFHSKV